MCADHSARTRDAYRVRPAVRCCIAGCGPAGAMLGFLLARAGVTVVVLEKHADFLRDFRGDTIHPSTLEILDNVGLADRFLRELPHSEVSQLQVRLPDGTRMRLDFDHLPSRFRFVAFVPQWDFLEFITAEAARYPNFTLIREAEVIDLLEDDGRVAGVRFQTPTGHDEIRADLTVGADGRTSRVREAAGLPLTETSPPMDVLWFRVSRREADGDAIELRLQPGHFFALINRREYWQVAYVIPKGANDAVRARGLDAFRATFADGIPELAERAAEITDWDQVKLLTVRADRLRRWYRPGVLCLGDAAHAMSPIAGVGINVAIQDAVEAANLLWKPLREGSVRVGHLARVQRRRELAVWLIQGFQGLLQENVLRPTLGAEDRVAVPKVLQLALGLPVLRELPTRFVALGVRRPHVRTPGPQALER
ncbi:MAG: FAD-dependent oxidoreductase, partial [Chloroflexi bacterium]|nr:FAD-dependent oxidoreductase [Chloroflexota bacterium]